MANKVIFHVLLSCSLTFTLPQNVESSLFGAIALPVLGGIVSLISPSDIDSAVKVIQDESKTLEQNIKGTINDISKGAEDVLDNSNSFLTNMKKSIKNAGKELKDGLEQSMTVGIGQMQNIFLTEPKVLVDLTEDIQSKAESVTSFLRAGLEDLSLALNKTRESIGPKLKIRKKLTAVIKTLLKEILTNSKVQRAILTYIVTREDEGSEVSTLKSILKALGPILIKTGNPALGAIALSIPALAGSESVSDILEPILLTTVKLGLTLG